MVAHRGLLRERLIEPFALASDDGSPIAAALPCLESTQGGHGGCADVEASNMLALFAAESSLPTHASPPCLSACRYLAFVLSADETECITAHQ